MTISLWRYSHLALAVSSFLLIALASITGIILAFEPISMKSFPYEVENFEKITLAETIPSIKRNFLEITNLTVDANDFVIVKGVDLKGKSIAVYINPSTGEHLGPALPKSKFFQWVTSLHRSLFLNELGRFFIGLTAFLLSLITVSGIALIIQRQRKLKFFFSKIIRENFFQYYHITLGRLLLIPILIIALSGTYLSLVRFEIIPSNLPEQQVDIDNLNSAPEKKAENFPIFESTPLAKVTSVEFPFSEDVEDYYTLKLKDRELTVNQNTGELLSESLYPFSAVMTELSLDLHTGRTNYIWAVLLALSSANILFFIYSGFAITIKRRSGITKNKYSKDDCKFIILVGSENGSTNRFAKVVYENLVKLGEKCYLAEMNSYNVFPKAEHLIIFAATYGIGDSPSNANRFLKLIEEYAQIGKVQFSILGFGSKAYPDFCKYAHDLHQALLFVEWAVPLMDVLTVNDKSLSDFEIWQNKWSEKSKTNLNISIESLKVEPRNLISLTVADKTRIEAHDDSFLIVLKAASRVRFKSGDLLAIYPANDHRERLYSIGKVDEAIQLSIKLHPNGLGSSYLYDLQPGQKIRAAIHPNPNFNLPKKVLSVMMISNGTGIAPFLGMINSNHKNLECHLYCGFRSPNSYNLYSASMEENLRIGKLTSLNIAYSRVLAKQYVNDLISRDRILFSKIIQRDGIIMICGSLAMQQDVLDLLDIIFQETGIKTVKHYLATKRILTDCY